tara:strand:- start:737 stop:904 length:168 start_codon:yes stop_codon:yes gene_type:complete
LLLLLRAAIGDMDDLEHDTAMQECDDIAAMIADEALVGMEPIICPDAILVWSNRF